MFIGCRTQAGAESKGWVWITNHFLLSFCLGESNKATNVFGPDLIYLQKQSLLRCSLSAVSKLLKHVFVEKRLSFSPLSLMGSSRRQYIQRMWKEDEKPSEPALGPNIFVMETDFHTKSRLSLASWGSLWYETRANPSCSGCCHVFILPTRCPFINLWLALALCWRRPVLNWLMLDWCCRCGSEKNPSVSHRPFFLRCWIVQH